MSRLKFYLGIYLVSVLLSASFARAGDPTITIGGGVEGTSANSTINVLLRIGTGFSVGGNNSFLGGQLVVARMRTDVAITQGGAGIPVPYMDIDFIPVQSLHGTQGRDGNLQGFAINLLPMNIHRDLRIDEQANFHVSAIGASAGTTSMVTSVVGLYAQVAADLLGYKVVSHVSSDPTINTGRVGGLSTELGMLFHANDNFNVRLALGGQADMNLGRNSLVMDGMESSRGGLLAQSDMQAYVELRLDVYNFLQVFARGSVISAWNHMAEDASASSLDHYFQAMGGVVIYF